MPLRVPAKPSTDRIVAALRTLAAACTLAALAACAPAAGPTPAPTAVAAEPAEPPSGTRAEPLGDPLELAIDPRVDLAPARPVVPAPRAAVRRRPAGAPDVVVLAFGGHCGALCGADATVAYLGRPDAATGEVDVLGAVVGAFERQGLTVEARSYSSHVRSHHSPRSGRTEPGWLDAAAFLERVRRDWIDGVADPARVVLVAHSHGAVWANLLALDNLEVTFDYLISLDAVCWRWWAVHRREVRAAFPPGELPFPLADGAPCGLYAVPGARGRRDVTDVIPANVLVGLEVRTALGLEPWDLNLVRDDRPDLRINGGRLNLWGIEADAGHAAVGSYGPATRWVADTIASIGLPDAARFPMERFVAPPAPPGFDRR